MQGLNADVLGKERAFFDLPPDFGRCHSVIAQTHACATEHVFVITLLKDFCQA